jgi:hypothetical protein
MSESSDARTRRRWINFGELVAVAALAVSAAGVWISWKNSGTSDDSRPARMVEQKQPIALVLHGRVEADGKRMQISPLEASHALESLSISLPGGTKIEVGGDGELSASDLDTALRARDKELKGNRSVPLRIEAHYVELGAEKKATGSYQLRYRWDGGGLFGGHSVRLGGLSRS